MKKIKLYLTIHLYMAALVGLVVNIFFTYYNPLDLSAMFAVPLLISFAASIHFFLTRSVLHDEADVQEHRSLIALYHAIGFATHFVYGMYILTLWMGDSSIRADLIDVNSNLIGYLVAVVFVYFTRRYALRTKDLEDIVL